MTRQMIAMGGGGFSMEPDNPLLDEYILHQADSKMPKVCFLPTASGDAENYIQRFYHSFRKHSCQPSHLSLFSPPTSHLEDYILDHDVIYVGGGNTRNLLVLWKEWGLDHILHKAWKHGVILAGLSAGSICWFEEGVTDSIPGQLTKIKGLGFLKGSNCPHYDGEEKRRPAYHRLIQEGHISSGVAADDGVALHYIDRKLHKIVSSRPEAKAYQVKLIGDQVEEEEWTPTYLKNL